MTDPTFIADTTPNSQTPPQNNKRTLLIVIIAVLLASNIVLIYLNYIKSKEVKQQAETITVKDNDIKIASAKLDSMTKEVDSKIEEIKQLGGDVESLKQLKTQLEADKVSLLRDKQTANFSLQKYQDKIKVYETMLETKDQEIKKLKGVNEELLSENTGLKTKQNVLADSIAGISKEKQDLQDKVTIASALKAENISVYAISEKGKERDDKDNEFKAKRVEKIKVVCQLAENKIAKIEGKNIFLRIVEPDGVTLSDPLSGGGTMNVNGKEMPYTTKQDILFDNTKQKITFVFKKGTPYKTGKHKVSIYSESFEIGTGSFIIK